MHDFAVRGYETAILSDSMKIRDCSPSNLYIEEQTLSVLVNPEYGGN